MASSTTNPPAAPDPFDLGIHTPANLNRGARAALLQNSPAAVNGTIGVSPGPRRMAQTPSSPLNASSIATATEGAERASPSSTFEQQPEYNAKLMVFQAFCAKFEEAAQQFTTGPQRRFAQQFADSFLDSWKRELSSAGPTIPKPTYSSVAAASPRTDRDRLTHRQQQQHGRRQTDPPHRQGQQTTIAPPRQDLRVFIRLEAGAPARAHSSYAIRTLIQEKVGVVSNKIRQVSQVRSGWAVLAADSETRDFLVEKQAEWAAELGATAVETNKEWFTYVVSDFPTRLTDFHGKEVDSNSIVSDEIEIQTGLKPVDIRPSRQFSDNPLTKTLLVSFLKPTKRFWSLFGSSAARLIDKTDRPRQCETCWGYHFARNCHRQPCINCLGPHQANSHKCPARPKRVHGVLRRLTKEQRGHVRTVGAEAYRQRHLAQQPESHLEAQQSATELQRDDAASHKQPSIRGPSPAASGALSCIMVATSPQAGYEAEAEPEHPRPGSPRKRRINNKKPLRIFQANVGKIPPAHDCALALADSERYDIVLLQEPWTAHTDTRSLTKTHPAYDTFTPVETWDGNDTRPRIMTYVRRDPRLLADQIRPFQTRDIQQMPPLQTASKKETADAFLRWMQSLDPLTLVVYSDGSLSSQGAASYGFTIHQGNFPVLDGSGRLGPAEVFDAEAAGALEGPRAAFTLQVSATQDIIVCLDNLAAATCLRGAPSDSSQDVFLEFQALVASHGATQVRWVPGHTDIPGNEQADKLSKAASSAPESEGAQPTLAYLRRIARQKPKEAFETWWSTAAPERYKRLNLKAATGSPPELSLPRASLHHLLAARSLHGDFAAYHQRFDHIDARLVCSCKRRKAPDHIFYCRKVPQRHRMRLSPSPNAAVNLAIGQDFTKFTKLSKASAFFGKICPHY
ncbi:hypothetical protein FOFC_18417 [Fusarium oxysporum]|nr:hypothetical protein FOFC_18417 [Fusarium oxysporum]